MLPPDVLSTSKADLFEVNPIAYSKEKLYAELKRTMRQPVERIAPQLNHFYPPDILRPYHPRSRYQEKYIFVTDKPEQLFGEGPVYSITSSLALENLKKGFGLYPPETHYKLKIDTHRGVGIELFSRFMLNMGIDLDSKDAFVWSGRKIDAEQLVIEHRIANAGQTVDSQLTNILFESDQNGKKPFKLHPQLIELLTILDNGDKPSPDSNINKYINTLLSILHQYTGIREGWYITLEQLLRGKITPEKKEKRLAIMEIFLHSGLTYFSRQSPKPSEAIILEIDTRKIFQKIPIFIFPVSDRPPDTIFPSIMIPPEAISKAFILPESNLTNSYSPIPLEPIKKIPPGSWMTDKTGYPINYQTVQTKEINPYSPLCSLRHKEVVSIWAQQILSGNITPWNNLALGDFHVTTPNDYFSKVMRTTLELLIKIPLLENLAKKINGSVHDAKKILLTDFPFKLSGVADEFFTQGS
ncbi:MAG: hypothetical protein ABIJ43_02090 [Candidatus Beckwithbacteria bacterium]|nr:hypothetical protein [Patescibacteria group bacterium]